MLTVLTASTSDSRHCSDPPGDLTTPPPVWDDRGRLITTVTHFTNGYQRRCTQNASPSQAPIRIKTKTATTASRQHLTSKHSSLVRPPTAHPSSHRATSQTKTASHEAPRQIMSLTPRESPPVTTQHTRASKYFVYPPRRGATEATEPGSGPGPEPEPGPERRWRSGDRDGGRSHGDLIVLQRIPGLLLAQRRDADDAALAGQHGEPLREELVHLARHLASLRDGPHDQRLAAPAVWQRERREHGEVMLPASDAGQDRVEAV